MSKNFKLGVSSSMFGILKEKNFEACIEAGINNMEFNFFQYMMEGIKEAEIIATINKGKSMGMNFWSIHFPYSAKWDISTRNEAKRKDIIKKHIELMEYALIMKAEKAVVHGSSEPLERSERKELLSICRDSLMQLSEEAEKRGIQLALECLPRTCLGNTTEEMELLIEGIDKLGVCCDTNHLLWDKPEDFIKKLGKKVTTLHVSDYDGINERHWVPGMGINNWGLIIKSLEEVDYTGPILFEVRNGRKGESVTPKVLKESWNKVRRHVYQF